MKKRFFTSVTLNGIATLLNIFGIKYFNDLLAGSQIYTDQIYVYSTSLIFSTVIGISCGNLLLKSERQFSSDYLVKTVTKFFIPFVLLSIIIGFFVSHKLALLVLCTYLLTIEHIQKSELLRKKRAVLASLYTLIGLAVLWMGTYFYFEYQGSFYLVIFVIITSILINITINFSIKNHQPIKPIKPIKQKITNFIGEVKYSFLSNIVGFLPQIVIINLLKATNDELFIKYVLYMYIFRAILFIPSAIQRLSVSFLNEAVEKRRFVYHQQMFIATVSLLLVLVPLIILGIFWNGATSFKEVDIFSYIIIASIFAAVSSPVGTYLISLGNYLIAVKYNSVYSVVYTSFITVGFYNLTLNYIFLCMAISYVIHFLLGQFLVRKL